jgi:hypothetical protein
MTHTFVNFGRVASTNILSIQQRGKRIYFFFSLSEKIINPLATRFSKVAFIS